jgi:GTP-sensing pleiotropic transcriptional regulator CodY
MQLSPAHKLTSSFAAVKNRIKLNHQHRVLSDIIDRAGASLVAEPNVDTAKGIRHIIVSATFMVSTIGYIMSSASRAELENEDVDQLIARAEIMTRIISGVVYH